MVPPSVNTPPGTMSAGVEVERENQKPISGVSSWPLVRSVCQKGMDCVAARGAKARPIQPPTGPVASWEAPWVAKTGGGCQKVGREAVKEKRRHEEAREIIRVKEGWMVNDRKCQRIT